MTLAEHLDELRRRLIVSLAALAIGTALVWAWSGEILSWLARPAGGLVFTAPTEAFLTRMRAAFFGGLLLSLPVILYEAWSFTACALAAELRRSLSAILPLSYALFLAGTALGVFVVVPATVRVLVGFGSADVRPLLSAANYLEFVVWLSLAFGAVFQLPVVLVFLAKAGVVTPETLRERRRVCWLAAFVAAAVLTPGPDLFSQVALAVPMILMFEGSLLMMKSGSPEVPTSRYPRPTDGDAPR